MAIKPKKVPRELIKIGELIKAERELQKLSLEKLSELAFNHKNYATIISEIERAKKKEPSFMTIIKILKALNFELF